MKDSKVMMIGMVSRLTDQKGFDLVDYVMDELCQDAVQIVVLGTGEVKYENMFRHFAWKYPEKVSANIFYSEEMSHKIYASADAFLMPSLFEPCGLSQLMSLRYGTAPDRTGDRRTERYRRSLIMNMRRPVRDSALQTTMPMRCFIRSGMQSGFTMIRKRDWNKIVERAHGTGFLMEKFSKAV